MGSEGKVARLRKKLFGAALVIGALSPLCLVLGLADLLELGAVLLTLAVAGAITFALLYGLLLILEDL